MLKRLTALALLLTLLLGALSVSAAVRPGDRGDQVAAIQQRLKNLNYFKGEVDGVYGDDTYHAVWWFQKNNGLKVDAVVGSATMAKLFPPSAEAPVASKPSGTMPRMAVGSRGAWVSYLQQRLKVLGYYTGRVDGVFGEGTRRAIVELQDNNAIAKDGVVGSRTGKLLFSENVIGKSARDTFSGHSKLRIKFGDRGEYVTRLQQRLKELGYFDGKVDGHFGYYTFVRVRWFQKAYSLKVDGVVGPATWGTLFPTT